ncbi:GyrI-like domain-containing protein [Allofournierella sp.]|uniref:GyrI-like domain-containing protein n=1 Tax=Allofournierella sp. TaxID=1940256 RepID=UPI003AB79B66
MKQLSPLERAVEYIEAHLNEDIGLGEVSRAAGYSYCHMTRLFSAVMGESVGRYIHRRRLYSAAEKLLHTDRRVLDIALDSGFASPEAFSRAFKAAFGQSPAAYRRAGLDLVTSAKRGLAPGDVEHIANNISHTPELVWQPEIKLAGIRGVTSLSDNRLPALWRQFLGLRAELLGPGSPGPGYGVCETQKTVYTKNGDVAFITLVGSPVKRLDGLPPPLVGKTVSAGKYAVFTHRGTLANLFITYQYIFGTWLPAAGEELDEREDFELYERPVTAFDDPDNEVKIFVPVR